jgi:hypothetical protein
LHGSGLDGDNSRSLERFRNRDDPNGHLGTGFEDVNTLGVSPIGVGREKELYGWKKIIQPARPIPLVILPISLKAIGCSPRTVAWDEIPVIDIFVYG